jgi:hypothetical protein
VARNSNSGWSRPWAAFFALVIILGGVAVSLGFGVRLRSALERNANTRVTTTSTILQTTVTDELSRYADSVRLAAAALSAQAEPTRAGFEEITAAVAAQELTAVRAITFIVSAAPDEVDAVGPYWRQRGARGLRPEPVNGLQQHLFTVFSRGLNKLPAPPLGADQGAAQSAVDVAKLAETGKDVAISDAYFRLADAKLPQLQKQLSFDVVAPVYGPRDEPAGFLVLNVVGSDFISSTLARAAGDLLNVQLLTRSGSGDLAEVAAIIRPGTGGPQFRRTQNFEAGQRQWTLRTSADYRTLLPNAGRTDMVVVVAGSALAVMFGSLMYLQMSATKRVDEEIGLEVAERVEEFEGRLRASLTAQESLVSELLGTATAAHATEVDLKALVDEVVAAGDAEVEVAVTVGDLPPVRTDAALLRPLVATMLTDARRRTPPGEDTVITVTADPAAAAGVVRLLVDTGGTVVACTLPAVGQMAVNPS